MSANMFQPASGRRLADQVAQQIKDNIFNGSLLVGDRLPPERELAKTFNTSSVVLREALHMLQTSGLLKIKKGATGGAFISEPTHVVLSESLSTLLRFGRATIGHLTEARMALEPDIAGLAAIRRSDNDIEALRQNVVKSRSPHRSIVEHRIEHLQFHRLLVSISGNPFLIAIVNSIIDNLEYNITKADLHQNVVADTTCYHTDLLEAICDRDQRLANKLMREHIRQIQGSFNQSS